MLVAPSLPPANAIGSGESAAARLALPPAPSLFTGRRLDGHDSHPGGITQAALSISVSASQAIGLATLIFDVPALSVTDRAGNRIEQDPQAIPLTFSVGGGMVGCLAMTCTGTTTPVCTCTQRPPDGVAAGGGGTVFVAVAVLIPLLLVLLWMCARWQRAVRRRRMLQAKRREVMELQDVLHAAQKDPDSEEGRAAALLRKAITISNAEGRPLREVAAELCKADLGADLGAVSAAMRRRGEAHSAETEALELLHMGATRAVRASSTSWVSVLRAAYDAHQRRLGAPAEHDRGALELLTAWAYEAAEAPITPGVAGGGGVRLRPPTLSPMDTAETANADAAAAATPRPSADARGLPPLTLQAAHSLLHDCKVGNGNVAGVRSLLDAAADADDGGAVEELDLLRDMLQGHLVLPAAVGAALMVEFSRRYEGAPPPTELQQVRVACLLRIGRSAHAPACAPWPEPGHRTRRTSPHSNCALTARAGRASRAAAPRSRRQRE